MKSKLQVLFIESKDQNDKFKTETIKTLFTDAAAVIPIAEMPKCCYECPCFGEMSADFCAITKKEILEYSTRPDFCPIIDIRKKRETRVIDSVNLPDDVQTC